MSTQLKSSVHIEVAKTFLPSDRLYNIHAPWSLTAGYPESPALILIPCGLLSQAVRFHKWTTTQSQFYLLPRPYLHLHHLVPSLSAKIYSLDEIAKQYNPYTRYLSSIAKHADPILERRSVTGNIIERDYRHSFGH